MASIVNTQELLETVVYAAISGIGITLIFSLGIYGSTRFADYSRDGRRFEAGLAGLLAVAAMLATIATLVGGLIVMTTK